MGAGQSTPQQSHSKVSVIIPTWKRGDVLRRCLQSLRRQTFSNFSICIVSNGAGDPAEELAQAFSCLLVSLENNRGFAAAVNAGIRATDSELVAVLNDDAELDTSWLEHMVRVLDGNPRLSFCSGKCYLSRTGRIDDMGDAIALSGSAWRLGHGREDFPTLDVPRMLVAISGTAALFRRAVFEQVGFFDEQFLSFLEDMDFSLRAARAGCVGAYVPAAVAHHEGGATVGGPHSPELFRLLTRNQLLLLAKNYPAVLWARLAPRILWAQFLWALMAIWKGQLPAYAKGIGGFLKVLPKILMKRPTSRSADWREMLRWLRESEALIHADIRSRKRSDQDLFWRLYFAAFPAKKMGGLVAPVQTGPAAQR